MVGYETWPPIDLWYHLLGLNINGGDRAAVDSVYAAISVCCNTPGFTSPVGILTIFQRPQMCVARP